MVSLFFSYAFRPTVGIADAWVRSVFDVISVAGVGAVWALAIGAVVSVVALALFLLMSEERPVKQEVQDGASQDARPPAPQRPVVHARKRALPLGFDPRLLVN